MKTRISTPRVQYSARGIPTYEIEIENLGLKKHKILRNRDLGVLQRKAHLEASAWDEVWEKRAFAEATRADHQNSAALANQITQDSQSKIKEAGKILLRALEVDDAIDWVSLYKADPFPEPEPEKKRISKPEEEKPPREPSQLDDRYEPQLNFFEKFGAKMWGRIPVDKIAAAQALFETDHAEWLQRVEAVKLKNLSKQDRYIKALEKADETYRQEVESWKKRKEEFEFEVNEFNDAINARQQLYLKKDKQAIEEYCEMVLTNSNYPFEFSKQFQLIFDANTGVLALDYGLPSLDHVPTLFEVKYVASRKDFVEKHLIEAQKAKLYDDIIYQISLRTLHELFEADTANALTLIVFNGWVTALNRATGHSETNCILSLQASKEEFLNINLGAIEAKTCFKQLRGVAAASLSSMTAIAPLIRLDRKDSRFVESYDVAAKLDAGVNLAAMDWQDFEHLIRQLFEKEFSINGGEVKVTQASRDGGVDAIAFDPDPIRGGRIVIQAKRYTNTVGVAAVRDLYGTVVNEGATKGILVTTTDYGPDAYEFAKNKPLTLMNGGNLLFLLQKHGQQARINIREAKMTLSNEN